MARHWCTIDLVAVIYKALSNDYTQSCYPLAGTIQCVFPLIMVKTTQFISQIRHHQLQEALVQTLHNILPSLN